MHKQSAKGTKLLDLGKLLVGTIGKTSKKPGARAAGRLLHRAGWGTLGYGWGEHLNEDMERQIGDLIAAGEDPYRPAPGTREATNWASAVTAAILGPEIIRSSKRLPAKPGIRSKYQIPRTTKLKNTLYNQFILPRLQPAGPVKRLGMALSLPAIPAITQYGYKHRPATWNAIQKLFDPKTSDELGEELYATMSEGLGHVPGEKTKTLLKYIGKNVGEGAIDVINKKGPEAFEAVTKKNPDWNEVAKKIKPAVESLAAAGGQIAAGADPVKTVISPSVGRAVKMLSGLGLGTVAGTAVAKLLYGSPMLALKDPKGIGGKRMSAEERDEWYKTRRKTERRRKALTALASVLGGQAGLAIADPEAFKGSMEFYGKLLKGLGLSAKAYKNLVTGKK